jgi:hypothetical protein
MGSFYSYFLSGYLVVERDDEFELHWLRLALHQTLLEWMLVESDSLVGTWVQRP